jgi:integrase
LLESIKPEEVDLEGWIFPSPEGGFINPHNFRVRAWTKVLEAAGVEYRTLYQTRHTFITNCLERGVPIPTIAKWVGNSPEVLMAHYAGSIREWSVPTF